jgi:hypothetical protein
MDFRETPVTDTNYQTRQRKVKGVVLVETRTASGQLLNLTCETFKVSYQSGGWGILYRPDSTRKYGVILNDGSRDGLLLRTKSGAVRTFADAEGAVTAAQVALQDRQTEKAA